MLNKGEKMANTKKDELKKQDTKKEKKKNK